MIAAHIFATIDWASGIATTPDRAEFAPFEHRRQNAQSWGFPMGERRQPISFLACAPFRANFGMRCSKLYMKTKIQRHYRHRKNDMELLRSRRWPSGVSGDGWAAEFVNALVQLEHNDLRIAAKFKQPDLTDYEATEIDALIPPGTLWLGG